MQVVTLNVPRIYRSTDKLTSAKKRLDELKRELALLGGYPSSRADSLEKEIKRIENLIKEIESLQRELASIGGYPKSRADFLKNEIEKKLSEIFDGAGTTRDTYVTLSQLKSNNVKWMFREILSYDLKTSIPTYKNPNNGRDITQADVDEINRVLEKYSINTPNRICHFLAQCYVECGGGLKPIEQFSGDVFEYFRDYETGEKAIWLGNTEKNDGAKFRGAGAIQVTGRANYKALSEASTIKNPQILNDGALYVGQKYFWESAGHYWSVYKPNSASTDIYNLNKKCDGNASVRDITIIINAGLLKLSERQAAYEYFKSVIK